MRPSRGRGWRRRHRVLLAVVVAIVVVGCGAARPAPAPGGAISSSGFPIGTFAREMTDPELGRFRLSWVFDETGRWAEVPEALDGQVMLAPASRGTYTVAGDTVTVDVSWPPDWGAFTLGWRMEGDDALWTTYRAADLADDAGWFRAMEDTPWVRVP